MSIYTSPFSKLRRSTIFLTHFLDVLVKLNLTNQEKPRNAKYKQQIHKKRILSN